MSNFSFLTIRSHTSMCVCVCVCVCVYVVLTFPTPLLMNLPNPQITIVFNEILIFYTPWIAKVFQEPNMVYSATCLDAICTSCRDKLNVTHTHVAQHYSHAIG